MKKIAAIISLVIITSSFPLLAHAVEPAPGITDREIVERLTRLEEGQKSMIREIDKRFEAVEAQIKQLRLDMNTQIKQLRVDMNAQFDRQANIMLGILAAFVVLLGGTIWFALWDRRTMLRPVEEKITIMKDELAENRTKLHSLLDALRALSKTDKRVAEVLRSFNLL